MPNFGLPGGRAEASRRNGAKSRGPKTPDGKARSSQNALKHGLRAQKHMVLPDEDAAEFEELEAALIDELAPDGVLQTLLVKRVAAAAWRMSRAERIEVEIFAENALPDGGPGLAMIRDSNRARAFETLVRYRGGTLAEFWRSLRTLKALQAEATTHAEPARLVVPGEELSRTRMPSESRVLATSCGKSGAALPPQPNEPKTRTKSTDLDQPTCSPADTAPTSSTGSPPAPPWPMEPVSSHQPPAPRSTSLLTGTSLVPPEGATPR